MSLDPISTTMRGVRVRLFGGPEVLQLIPMELPEPQSDEILIRVHATSVNPVDCKTRQGKFPKIGQAQLPWIPGRDFAGVIHQASFSSTFRKGDEVYGMPGFDRGTYADFVVARATEIAKKPASLDMIQAASVPLVALTAWQGLFDHGNLQPGQRCLVHGGAGGVGHFAIQLAKAKGATVLATASTEDLDFVKELGADEAIDFRKQSFELIAKDCDVVLDLVGGDTQARSWESLKQGGTLVSTVSEPSKQKASEFQSRGVHFLVTPSGQQLMHIASLIDHHQLRPTISRVFPIDDVRDAHIASERGGFRGKLGLRL